MAVSGLSLHCEWSFTQLWVVFHDKVWLSFKQCCKSGSWSGSCKPKGPWCKPIHWCACTLIITHQFISITIQCDWFQNYDAEHRLFRWYMCGLGIPHARGGHRYTAGVHPDRGQCWKFWPTKYNLGAVRRTKWGQLGNWGADSQDSDKPEGMMFPWDQHYCNVDHHVQCYFFILM